MLAPTEIVVDTDSARPFPSLMVDVLSEPDPPKAVVSLDELSTGLEVACDVVEVVVIFGITFKLRLFLWVDPLAGPQT